MRVGVFGGSFDPPHIAHSIIAETVRLQFDLDLVLWVPVYDPPHKLIHQLAPYETRMAMVGAATEDHPAFEISDVEKTLNRPTYTVRMLNALENQYPAAQLNLVMGSDSLSQFNTWSEPEAIIQLAQLLVYPRPDHSVRDMKLPEYLCRHIQHVNAPIMSLSAEYIRRRLVQKKSIRYLVSERVLDYIERYRPYTG